MVVSGGEEVTLRVPISRSISDINLRLENVALNYITSKNKAIDVRGPVFCTITCTLKE
jgi:O-phosphoseryl-tRNA synthetase